MDRRTSSHRCRNSRGGKIQPMVIRIAACSVSSIVYKGISIHRQIFGPSSRRSIRSRAISSLTALFRRSSGLPTRFESGVSHLQLSLSGRASRGSIPSVIRHHETLALHCGSHVRIRDSLPGESAQPCRIPKFLAPTAELGAIARHRSASVCVQTPDRAWPFLVKSTGSSIREARTCAFHALSRPRPRGGGQGSHA